MSNMTSAEKFMNQFMEKLNNNELSYGITPEDEQFIKDLITAKHTDPATLEFLNGLDIGRKQGINLMSNKARQLGFREHQIEHNKCIRHLIERIHTECPDLTETERNTIDNILHSAIEEIDSMCM